MASQQPVREDDIQMVASVTGLKDINIISSALRNHKNIVEAVVGEYFDSGFEKFTQRHGGWDESAFASTREGDQSTFTQNTNPSFAIHAPDEHPVIHGQDPDAFYSSAAPSRPPSRANNRSPLSRTVDLTAGDLSRLDKEDALLQQAINESLQLSNPQSQGQTQRQGLPPPPPLPQQSGILSTGEASGQHFGPATRTVYEESEWALTRYNKVEMDPKPSDRRRRPDTPVFLRRRPGNGDHRIGGILTILNEIPAARNALLRAGTTSHRYGHAADWWCGNAISRSGIQPTEESPEDAPLPDWYEELHRLVAFLNYTERSYGTADILAQSRSSLPDTTGNLERDFFEELENDRSHSGAAFRTSVEITSLQGDASEGVSQCFTLLDNQYRQEALGMAESLYTIWDMIFYADTGESPDLARMAMIIDPGDVITCRFDGDEWPNSIEIPETFYVDRYMAENRFQMSEIQRAVAYLNGRFQESREWEEGLKSWYCGKTGSFESRLEVADGCIKACQDRITRIKNRAHWREHLGSLDQGERLDRFYIDALKKEPTLRAEEAKAVQFYQDKVNFMEAQREQINKILTENVMPERARLDEDSRRIGGLLTGPSQDEQWNATHKYTLRGVTSNPDTVFVRKYEQNLMGDADESTSQWWKLQWNNDNNTLLAEPTTYEAAMREACSKGCKPIIIYANHKAMAESPIELPDTLKTFVRDDNQLFKKELRKEEQEKAEQPGKAQAPQNDSRPVDNGHIQEMGADLRSTLRAAGMKSQERRDSMDSMATNQSSSIRGVDAEMADAPASAPQLFTEDDALMTDAPLVDVENAEQVGKDCPVSPPSSAPEMQERAHGPIMLRSAVEAGHGGQVTA
ncbi:hypothetical protein OQA88_6213 [Cercophora sp. LCS_1]